MRMNYKIRVIIKRILVFLIVISMLLGETQFGSIPYVVHASETSTVETSEEGTTQQQSENLDITESTTNETTEITTEVTTESSVNATTESPDNTQSNNQEPQIETIEETVLEDMVVSSDMKLTEDTTVNNLVINKNYTLNLNGYILTVEGNSTIRGSLTFDRGELVCYGNVNVSSDAYVTMNNANDYILVYGNLTYYGRKELTAGTIEVKGDFTANKSIVASGSNKFIFSGDKEQKISVSDEGKFNVVELKNYSTAGVTIVNTFNYSSLVKNDCVINFATLEGERGYTLTEDTEHEGTYYLVSDILDLNGHTLTINGDLIQAGGTIKVNGGKLIVNGNYRIQSRTTDDKNKVTYGKSTGTLNMTNEADYVYIDGDFINDTSTDHTGKLTEGVMEITGDVEIKNVYSKTGFFASDNHTVIMTGEEKQSILIGKKGDLNTTSNSHFANLVINNTSEEGVEFSSYVYVSKSMDVQAGVTSGVLVISSETEFVSDCYYGDVYVYGSTSSFVHEVNIAGNVTVSGGVTLTKNFTVDGNITGSRGSNYIKPNGASVNVTGDSTYVDYRLADASDYVFVGGNLSLYEPENMLGGTVELKGNLSIEGTKALGEKHRFLLSGDRLQTVESAVKLGILELQNYSDEGVYSETSIPKHALVRNGCKLTYGNIQGEFGWTLTEDYVYDGDLVLIDDELNLNGHTLTVTGDLIQISGTINTASGKLHVLGDYRMQGVVGDIADGNYTNSSGYIVMGSDDIILVEGDMYYYSANKLESGTLELKGNLYATRLDTGDNCRFLFSGEQGQTIGSETTDYFNFANLEFANTSEEGLKLIGLVWVYKYVDDNTTQVNGTIRTKNQITFGDSVFQGSLYINNKKFVMPNMHIKGDLTNDYYLYVNDGITLKVDGDYIDDGWDTYIYGDFTVGGDCLLPGSTIVRIITGSLAIKGDIVIDSDSAAVLAMTKSDAYCLVEGDILIEGEKGNLSLQAGVLEVKGDIDVSGKITTKNDHTLLLSGDTLQTIKTPDDVSWGTIELQNYSEEGVFAEKVFSKNKLIRNGCRLRYGDCQGEFGWTLSEDQTWDGDLIILEDTLDLNGHTLTVTGDLVQQSGDIKINGGKLVVKGDYRMQTISNTDKGVTYGNGASRLIMTNAKDYVLVEGDYIVSTLSSQENCCTAGTLEIKGNIEIDNAKQTNAVYFGENHTLLLSGEDKQTISTTALASKIHIGGVKLANTSGEQIATDGNIKIYGIISTGNNSFDKAINIGSTASFDNDYYEGNIIIDDNYSINAGEKIHINGNVELNGYAYVRGTFIVDGNLTMKKGNIEMAYQSPYVKVNGDLTVQSYIREISVGTLEVAGNITSTSTFTTSGTAKLVLTGDNKQIIDIPYLSNINILELKNTSKEGVYSGNYFSISELIENKTIFTIGVADYREGYTLEQDTVIPGDYYLGYGKLNLNGHKLTIEGDLIHAGGNIWINGGQLNVSGDYIQSAKVLNNGTEKWVSSTGTITMDSSSDKMYISGDLELYAHPQTYSQLNNGSIYVDGDINYHMDGNSNGNYKFSTYEDCKVYLQGSDQTITGQGCSLANLYINTKNTLALSGGVTVTKKLVSECGDISGTVNIVGFDILESNTYNGSLNVTESDVLDANKNIKGTLILAKDLDLNGYEINCNNLNVNGSLDLNGGRINCLGDCYIGDKGALSMQDGNDYLCVGGDMEFHSRVDHTELLTAGTLELKGDFTDYYKNFKASEDHVTILGVKYKDSGKEYIQYITFSYEDSSFNTLVLKKELEKYIFSHNVENMAVEIIYDIEATVPPQPVKNLKATAIDMTSVTIQYEQDDKTGTIGYVIYRNGKKIGSTGVLTYKDSDLEPDTTYSYEVYPVNSMYQQAEMSPEISATTLADTEAPTVPENLSITGITGSAIAISWNSSTDNRGVSGYEVYRDGECIQIITGADIKTSYKDSGLTDTNKHTYEVLAYDQAGNKSEKSAEVTGNTIMPVITKTDPVDYSQLNNRTQKLTLFYKNMGYGASYTVDIMYREKGKAQWVDLDTTGVKSTVYNAQTYIASYDWDTSPLTGSEYEVKYLVKDEDGNEASEIVSYYVDNTAPALPAEFNIHSMSGVLKLSWTASISYDCDRYNIYRRVYDSGEEYKLIYTEYNKLVETYTDVNVEEGVFYEYVITAVDTSGNESSKSESVKALVKPDEEEPVISGVSPETGKLSGNAQISITAKDNKELSAVTISYKAEGSEQWIKLTDIATKGETVYYNLNTKSYPDGVYYFNFEATDAVGNKNGEEYTRRYEIDNTGISKVNITEVTAGSTYVQLKWDDVPEKDFAYFQVEQFTNGYYSSIARVNNVLGYTVEGLEPNKTYNFRVVAYDNVGNKGTYSDVKSVSTTEDTTAPVINAVYPIDTHHRSVIDLTVRATDNNRIDYASFYYSTDGESYIKVADVKNTANLKGEVWLSHSLKLSDLPEGKLYIKYEVYDKAGNKNPLTADGKDVINEYIVDKTAPSSPANLVAVSHDGYIGLSWDKPADADISCYRIYRAAVEDGIFVTLSDNLKNSTYNDANVEPGKSYIYKMIAVDKAGNVSQYSNQCTASATRDKTAPYIAGIALNDGTVVGEKTELEIIARDNSKLSHVEIDIKDSEEDIWLNVDKKDASGSIYQTTLDLKLENMPEGEYTYRIKAVDKEGNESDYIKRTFKLDTTPAVGDIAAITGDLCIRLDVTLPEDEDFASVDIYRRKKAAEGETEESFTKIYSGKEAEYIDKDITPWQEYEYKLHSYDNVGNFHVSNIVSAYGTDNDVISPIAVLPENVRVMEGMELQLDGGESTDNVRIKSYAWSINDGATYTGRLITHTFKEAGEYTVTLKVTDVAGNSSSTTTKVKVIKKDGSGTITINVVDTEGTPVPYASVYLSDSLNSDKSYKTDGAGKVTISAARGEYKAAAYKSGYIPKDIDVTVNEYTDTEYIITIPSGEIVVGDFNVHKMTLQEMVEAGVDFSAPENMHHVTMYIELSFIEQPIPVIYECEMYFSGYGMDSGKSGYLGYEGGGPGGGGNPEERPQVIEIAPQYSYIMNQPILVYVSTRQTVSWLKDMYSVELGVLNTADTKYVIEDSKATINLPQGLSLATTFEGQKKTIEIGDIAGQEKKNVSWVVKGDTPGEYEITADFEGNLMPFNTPVEARFTCTQTIDVTDYEGLKITIMPEDTAFTGYGYYIQFKVENGSDKPLYNFSTSFGPYVSPGLVTETYYVEPGSEEKKLVDQDFKSSQVIEEMSVLTQTPVLVGDEVLTIQTLNPGQTIYGTYSRAFPGVADPTEYYYALVDSMVEIIEGKDLGVDVTIDHIPGHICKIIIKGGVADYTYGDPVDVSSGAYLDSYEAIAITGRDILSLDLNYNSIYSATKGELGMGWSHNFESYIVEEMGMIHYYTSPYACASFVNEDSLNGLKYGTMEGNTLTLSSDTGKDTVTYRSITTGMDGYILTKNPDGTYTMTTPAGYIYEYGADGKLARMTIEEGRGVSISHAPNQMIVTEDATGNRLKLDYNEGRLISVTDNTGRITSFAYTGDYLTTITNPVGETISYEYDEAGRLIKGKNHYGEAFVTNTYDEEGKVVKQLDDKGNEISFTYTDTEGGRITKCTAADGSITTYESDKRGNITHITSPTGATTSYTFDEYGNKVKTVDAYGNAYNYSYDEKGNLETYQTYDGGGLILGYDEDGKISTISGYGDELTGTYTYDERGNIIYATDGVNACSYTYDEHSNLTSLTREGKGTTSYTYDDKGIFLTSITAENGSTSYIDYDNRGNMVRACDAIGNETKYEYDDVNRLQRTIYPDGGQVSYTYDIYGNVTSVTDPMGNVTYHTYDTAGRHTSTTYADGTTETYFYDENNNLIKAQTADGRCINYEYDVSGNMTKVTYPDGTCEEYSYDMVGQLSSLTDIYGKKIQLSYNGEGTLSGITGCDGQSIEATYGDNNNITGLTSSTGDNASYTYDYIGNLTSITDALGNTTAYDYSEWGELISDTDANGNKTIYTYDEAGQCVSITKPDGLVIHMVYDPCGRVSEAYVDRGAEGKFSVSYTYDSMGNVSTYTDEMGNTTTYEYDLNGNLISVTDTQGIVTAEYTYDCMGKVLQEKTASGIVVTYSYNKLDLVEKMVMTSPTGEEKVYTYTYDEMGRVLSVTDPSGIVSSQSYDSYGNVTDIVYPEGGGISYTYDDYGRVTEEKLSIGTSNTYEYNADSLLSQYTNGRGQETEYSYDAIGRITSFSDELGTISYTYDGNGNVLKTSETTKDGKTSTITRTYDCMNRVTSYTDYKGNTVKYGYDELGNLITLTYPGGEIVRYDYDKAGLLTTVTDEEGFVTSYSYDDLGRLHTTTKPDGSVETVTYDKLSRVTQSEVVGEDSTLISRYTYVYDSWGNIVSTTYQDETEEGRTTTNSATSKGVTNSDGSTTVSMTYDSSNRMVTYNGEDVLYDDDGNMLYGPLDGVMTEFEYDCRNRLVRAGDTYYEYDAENVRTATETPEYREEYITESVSQFSRVLVITREYKTEDKTDTEKYYYGNGLIYEKSSEVGVLVYHYNHLGSTTAVTDGEGNLVYSFDYGTYGELKSTTEYDNTAPVIRFLYNGQLGVMTDGNSLYYMRSRYYNPDIKRFINQDVLIGSIGNSDSLNRYSYVEGNPVSYTDPFGLSPYGNFGTFLTVMKFMSQIDIMSLVHVTLSALGALPGCTWLNWINAGLYLAEQNYSEMCKSLLFGVANLDWVTYAAKFAVKIGKYTEKLDKILKCIDLGLHLKACYESAVDFGTIAAGMIDKYLVNGEEVTWDIALEFLMLAGTGLQLGLLTHSLTGKLSTTFGGSSLDGGGVSSVTKNKHVLEAVDDAPSSKEKPGNGGNSSQIVYRGDRASVVPEDVFQNGIKPKGTHNDALLHTKSNATAGNFVSTSSDMSIATDFGGKNGHVYVIKTDNYVDINSTYATDAYFPEQKEFSIPGGVKPSEIVGAYKKQNGKIIGDFIPNPNFGGN